MRMRLQGESKIGFALWTLTVTWFVFSILFALS